MNARHVQLNLNAGERDSLRHPHPNPNGRLINFTQNHVHLEEKKDETKTKENTHALTLTSRCCRPC